MKHVCASIKVLKDDTVNRFDNYMSKYYMFKPAISQSWRYMLCLNVAANKLMLQHVHNIKICVSFVQPIEPKVKSQMVLPYSS